MNFSFLTFIISDLFIFFWNVFPWEINGRVKTQNEAKCFDTTSRPYSSFIPHSTDYILFPCCGAVFRHYKCHCQLSNPINCFQTTQLCSMCSKIHLIWFYVAAYEAKCSGPRGEAVDSGRDLQNASKTSSITWCHSKSLKLIFIIFFQIIVGKFLSVAPL